MSNFRQRPRVPLLRGRDEVRELRFIAMCREVAPGVSHVSQTVASESRTSAPAVPQRRLFKSVGNGAAKWPEKFLKNS